MQGETFLEKSFPLHPFQKLSHKTNAEKDSAFAIPLLIGILLFLRDAEDVAHCI